MAFSLEQGLAALKRRDRLRALAPRAGMDFTSNDYLALAESAMLKTAAAAALARGVPVGAGGSRLLRGNHPEHEALEAEAASFFGSPAALYLNGGYLANLALFATLPQRGDLVVNDAAIHASVHEGLRASRAEHVVAAHNDVQAFDDAARAWRAAGGTGRIWFAVESLYSMDGDCAPLSDLHGLARRHDGVLVVDEAHATGALGPQGRGLAAALEGANDVVTLHTCGKALGASGALLCTSVLMREFLVNRARPFIYATAPSPLMAAVTRASLALVRDADESRARLVGLVRAAGEALVRHGVVALTGTHIQPVIVGSDARAVALARAMQERGYDIRAIRPPTVPEGTARLRLALTLHADETAVGALAAQLGDALRTLAA